MRTLSSAFVYSVESVKNSGLMLRSNAWAIIPDGYYDIPGLE